jgi:uncharacterized protein (TIGR02246 family)
MTRYKRSVVAALAVFAVAAAVGLLCRSNDQDRAVAAAKDKEQPSSPEMEAVRKTADAFAKAFNAGDAKAVAAFWTKDGEFVGADGDTIRGRDEIEKSYAEFFKSNPKTTIAVEIESVRLLGRYTALEEGTLKVTRPGDKEPGVSRYSVLHVREDDGWRMASVREWVPDPQELVTVKDVEWLLGKWVAKSNEGEISITYAWDEDKVFLRGRYILKKGDRTISSGTQIIGKNPEGGLRSWVFDSSGAYGQSVWTRDENRWVIEAEGTLPDGSEVTATNLLIPIGKDSFTWQGTERTAAGSELPDTAPLKVTRVKADK